MMTFVHAFREKNEAIRLSPMTKEKSKKKRDNTKKPPKTSIT